MALRPPENSTILVLAVRDNRQLLGSKGASGKERKGPKAKQNGVGEGGTKGGEGNGEG